MKNNLTLIELRDRCNELLAGTSMPSYDTGISSIGPAPGEMRLAVSALTAELHDAEAEIDRLSLGQDYWRDRANDAEDKLADTKAALLCLQQHVDSLPHL